MWLLIIISLLVPMICIGYFISRVDKFFVGGGFDKEPEEVDPTAIVLGNTELANQITGILQGNSIPVLSLSEPFLLEQCRNFRYLFALSENDADNLVLCKIGKRVYNIEKMICLCNNRRNEGLFLSEKTRYITVNEATAQKLYQAVMKSAEVRL